MTELEFEEKINARRTYITEDEEERLKSAIAAIDAVRLMSERPSVGVILGEREARALMSHALQNIWLELDGLLADWKCRMPKEEEK